MFNQFILEGVPPLVFWPTVIAAIIIQGISKSGFAGGVGILSLPLMMLVMPAEKVPAVLLPLLILLDLNAIYHHRANKDWVRIRRIYVPALFGILVGAAAWWWMGQTGIEHYERAIKIFVGCIAIVFALYVMGKETASHLVERYRPGPITTWVVGIIAGFCSTIAHAAGPIVSLYFFTQGMGKTLFVGCCAWAFTLINITKLPIYVAVDLIGSDMLLFGLCLVPFIPVGSYLGHWMHHRVSERVFNRVILVLTVLAAIQLLSGKNVILDAMTWLTN
jgi:uncharacterized membrane protein YfcA